MRNIPFNGFAREAIFPEVTVYWLEHPSDSHHYGVDYDYRVAKTEEICRAEAVRCGLQAVVIRVGVHDQRNQHDAAGTVKTVKSKATGNTVNDIVQADWHITVCMGKDPDNLIISGHIYVVWDKNQRTQQGYPGLRRMLDASERMHGYDDNWGPVAYWTLK